MEKTAKEKITGSLAGELAGLNARVRINEPLARYTTLRVGGPAEYYVEPRDMDALTGVLSAARRRSMDTFVIGAGSNLLVGDKGIGGIVIRLRGAFEELDFEDSRCTAGGGVMWPFVIKKSFDSGYSGFEPLAGIPGTVGGLAVMNAGTPGGNISDHLVEAGIIDSAGKLKTLPGKEIEFGYRSSSLEGSIVTRAVFELEKKPAETILANINAALDRRKGTQPLGTLNAGCVFRNPEGGHAGKLIEETGMKGRRAGGAVVSRKHANFIINTGNASAGDIYRLIFEIRDAVARKTGVKLELEIKLLGF